MPTHVLPGFVIAIIGQRTDISHNETCHSFWKMNGSMNGAVVAAIGAVEASNVVM